MPRVPVSTSQPGQSFAGTSTAGAGLVAGTIAESADRIRGIVEDLHERAMERHARMGALEAQTDLTRQLSEIDAEIQRDPGDGTQIVQRGFEAGQEAIQARLERIEDPRARELVQAFGLRALAAQADRHARFAVSIQKDVEGQRLDELADALATQSALGTDAERELAEQEYNEALDAAAFHSEAERAARLSSFMQRQANARIEGLIDAGDPEAALAELEDPDLNLPPERRGVLRRAAQREQEALVREAQDETNAQLVIDIEKDAASVADVERAYAAGDLRPGQRAERWLQAQRKVRAAAEDQAALHEVQLVREGLELPRPNDADYRKTVDRVYAKEAATLRAAGAGFEGRLLHGVKVGQEAGYLPSPVQGMLDAALRSGDAREAMLASQTVETLRKDAPALLKDVPARAIEASNLVQSFAAVDADTAVGRAREVLSAPPAEREFLKDRYREEVQDNSNQDWLDSKVGDVHWMPFVGDVEIPTALRAEAEEFIRASYLRHGDLEAARKTFLDARPGNWQVSRVGAGGRARWVRQAPEALYGTGDPSDAEWMTSDLVLEARPFLPEHLRGLDDDALGERLAVASDTETDRDGTYAVVEVTEGGALAPVLIAPVQGPEPFLDDDPRWMRWHPDAGVSPSLAAAREADVEAARRRRELRREFGESVVGQLLDVFTSDFPEAVRDLAEEERRRAREAGRSTAAEGWDDMVAFWGAVAKRARGGTPATATTPPEFDLLEPKDVSAVADRLADILVPAADRLARRISPPRRERVPRGTPPTLGGGGGE